MHAAEYLLGDISTTDLKQALKYALNVRAITARWTLRLMCTILTIETPTHKIYERPKGQVDSHFE